MRVVAEDSGSVLVEALIGIGLLAVLTASLASFSRTWVVATETSGSRTAALDAGVRHLQAEVLASGTIQQTRSDPGRYPVSSTSSMWQGDGSSSDPCAWPIRSRLGGASVDVEDASDRRSGTLLSLRATRLEPLRLRRAEADVSVVGSAVRVEGIGVAGLQVRIGVGADAPVVTIAEDGCLELPPLPPGRHVLRPSPEDGRPTPIDAAHRSGDAAAIAIDVLDRPATARWRLSEGAGVLVDVEDTGARTPDVVRPGALRWSVRDDDSRSAAALGSSRLLHPGITTIVVSACSSPEALGSTATVDIQPGVDRQVAVRLAEAVLYGLTGREGEAVSAVRTTGCADGGAQRPELRWEGSLSEGMRIALPRGEWDVRVETISGTRITAPVRVVAAGLDAEVTFP
jgi:hypothetical protein